MDSSSLPPEINIITLNCWGLKFNISKLREARLAEIGRQISHASPAPNLVCLQEVWAQDDYLTIRRQLRALLPYGKFYHAGAFGAGLVILSRWPLEESTYFPYTLNGRPTAFWRGDWYVGKGVAHARIRFGGQVGGDDDNVVEVFTTHTHAPYSGDPEGDSYRVHREAQSWQLAKLLRAAAERGHLVLAAGDFNMTPLSPEHRIITAHAPVRDVWRVLHPDSSLGSADEPRELARRGQNRAAPTAEANLCANGATSDSVLNTWRWPKPAQRALGPGKPLGEPALSTPDPAGKRLDYIFASTGARALSDDEIGGWVIRDARVGMTQRHPELGCSLSDHFAVEATLVYHVVSREDAEGAPSTINWPIPPGRVSNLSVFRRSTYAKSEAVSQMGQEDDLRSPAAGAFLSLHSPTPSTSRQSRPADPNSTHSAPAGAAADFDTQLLSSVSNMAEGVDDGISFAPREYDSLLSGIQGYVAREASQTRRRTYHFVFWVCVMVACFVVVWFIPTHSDSLSHVQNHAINFVLLAVSSLGLAAGVLDGLMALLFFRGSEKRALEEFTWEVHNAKALALGDAHPRVEESGAEKS